MKRLLYPVAVFVFLHLSSCTSYVTPGRQANLAAFTDPNLKKSFSARPAITFPANLAVVRVQESGYRSESVQGTGTGAYSVITTRDVEKESHFEAISSQPGIRDVATLTSLLLPSTFASDLDLRAAAARLQADAILVYTIGTTFDDGDIVAPLTVLSLGLAPNKKYKISATASAILMDTKTGFIYGALEELETRSGLTMAWGSRGVIEDGRRKAEGDALDKLVESFGPFWSRVYSRYR